MRTLTLRRFALSCLVVAGSIPVLASERPESQALTATGATVAELQEACSEAGPAMAARQERSPLFARVGGRDGLHAVVVGTVDRHYANPEIKHLFQGLDPAPLIGSVTDFLVVGTGGEGEYHGADMKSAHSHLQIGDLEFLSAARDLEAAMKDAGWADAEREELLCAFVGLYPQVVAPK